MALTQTARSTQFVVVQIDEVVNALTGEPVDYTDVRLGLTPVGETPTDDTVWHVAAVDETSSRAGWLRGKNEVPKGTYTVWLDLKPGAEHPEIAVGTLVLN